MRRPHASRNRGVEGPLGPCSALPCHDRRTCANALVQDAAAPLPQTPQMIPKRGPIGGGGVKVRAWGRGCASRCWRGSGTSALGPRSQLRPTAASSGDPRACALRGAQRRPQRRPPLRHGCVLCRRARTRRRRGHLAGQGGGLGRGEGLPDRADGVCAGARARASRRAAPIEHLGADARGPFLEHLGAGVRHGNTSVPFLSKIRRRAKQNKHRDASTSKHTNR